MPIDNAPWGNDDQSWWHQQEIEAQELDEQMSTVTLFRA